MRSVLFETEPTVQLTHPIEVRVALLNMLLKIVYLYSVASAGLNMFDKLFRFLWTDHMVLHRVVSSRLVMLFL